ncbi:unnamed protein product [Tilletia caries]|uniref:Uncharacterized protein n=1 Tax=Tilletia caries TaxID=13290 RepID=A0ABN7INN1_9BASI|nr:unnamed protein product [Tilletia caries]
MHRVSTVDFKASKVRGSEVCGLLIIAAQPRQLADDVYEPAHFNHSYQCSDRLGAHEPHIVGSSAPDDSASVIDDLQFAHDNEDVPAVEDMPAVLNFAVPVLSIGAHEVQSFSVDQAFWSHGGESTCLP